MKQHLCVGGPYNGQMLVYDQARLADYTPFNCAHGGDKTKHAKRWALKRDRAIIPSMVWLHASIFKAVEQQLMDA